MFPDSVFQKFPMLYADRLELRQVRVGDEDGIYSFKSGDSVTAAYLTEPYSSKSPCCYLC